MRGNTITCTIRSFAGYRMIGRSIVVRSFLSSKVRYAIYMLCVLVHVGYRIISTSSASTSCFGRRHYVIDAQSAIAQATVRYEKI